MARVDIRGRALVGARNRLTQIAAEASEIYKAFPKLRSHAMAFGKRAGRAVQGVGGVKRRTMSAEARRRISEAQKGRWATYRKERES
jgi:hypothetical protein